MAEGHLLLSIFKVLATLQVHLFETHLQFVFFCEQQLKLGNFGANNFVFPLQTSCSFHIIYMVLTKKVVYHKSRTEESVGASSELIWKRCWIENC